MLQLNVAPSPNPAASQPSAGPAAQSADGIAAGNANSQADSQFASVLKDQIKRTADSKTAQPGNAKAEAAAAADASKADVPVDALALLAPMLAGLAPAKTPASAAPGGGDPGQEVPGDDTQLQGGDPAALAAAASPVALAAPAISPAPASGAAKSPAAAGLPSDTPETQFTQAQPKAGTALPATANLAAVAATAAESSAETGKSALQPESFQSLLNAANDAQAMAGHQAAAQRAAATAAAPAASATVTTPVGSRGWDNEVGEKVTWMVGRQETRAELVLNPPEFGRIEVSLSIKGDQANAIFTSANPAVREALENAMPRLRELLQDAGISLGQSEVGAESFRQSANQRENGDNPRPGQGRDSDGGRSMPTGAFSSGGSQVQWQRRGSGMVDTFA